MAVILITGTSTGIGQEAAIHLAKAGHKVYASCRNPDSATELQERIKQDKLGVSVIALDLLSPESVQQCIDTIIEKESLKRRGDVYRHYQETTSMFIPLPKRSL